MEELRWNKYEDKQPEISVEVLLVHGTELFLAWLEYNPFDEKTHWYCSDDLDFLPIPEDKWVYTNDVLKTIKD